MAATTGLVIIKKFTYRGDNTEQWSNRYWFQGAPPGPSSAWESLFEQLVAVERACYTPGTSVIGGYGYDDNTDGAHAIWSIDLESTSETLPGTLVVTPGNQMAGDQAGMIEWQTQRKNSRGKWIYLRKYFHGGGTNPTDPDRIGPETQAAYDVLVQKLRDGSWSSGRIIRSQKQDETFNWASSSPFVTTRTLKRRGKRP